jgi:hypothetical protein
MSTDLLVARGQQIVGLLLSTMALAERMLLYNVALTAWILLPQRLLLQKSLQKQNPSPPPSPKLVARSA